MLDDITRRIHARLTLYRVEASRTQLDALQTFVGHLTNWNKNINLTALNLDEGLDGALDRLVVEPFLAAGAIRKELGQQVREHGLRIVDLGSGGGSPGIPLSIALETTRTTLVESKSRKASFLRDVLRELGWPSAEVLQARMDELWADPTREGTADIVSVRALAMEPADWRGAARLLAEGGRVAWFRSVSQNAAQTAPLSIKTRQPLTGPDSELVILAR